MEYLPFGETLVDEHLNSNNSPFKFNEGRNVKKMPSGAFLVRSQEAGRP
jgi:hypothetical protein